MHIKGFLSQKVQKGEKYNKICRMKIKHGRYIYLLDTTQKWNPFSKDIYYRKNDDIIHGVEWRQWSWWNQEEEE